MGFGVYRRRPDYVRYVRRRLPVVPAPAPPAVAGIVRLLPFWARPRVEPDRWQYYLRRPRLPTFPTPAPVVAGIVRAQAPPWFGLRIEPTRRQYYLPRSRLPTAPTPTPVVAGVIRHRRYLWQPPYAEPEWRRYYYHAPRFPSVPTTPPSPPGGIIRQTAAYLRRVIARRPPYLYAELLQHARRTYVISFGTLAPPVPGEPPATAPPPILDISPVKQFTGNGARTIFETEFVFLAAADVNVYVGVALQTITADYTITGALEPFGGEVTLLAAPAVGAVVTLERQTPISRLFDYGDAAGIPVLNTFNTDLSVPILILQEMEAQLARLVGLPATQTVLPVTTWPTPAAGNADKFLQWNAGETALENSTSTSVPANPRSGWINDTWHQAADAAAARALLGLGTVALAEFGTDPDEVPRVADLGGAAFRDTGKLPQNVPLWEDIIPIPISNQLFLVPYSNQILAFNSDGIVRTTGVTWTHTFSAGNTGRMAYGGPAGNRFFKTLDMNAVPMVHYHYRYNPATEVLTEPSFATLTAELGDTTGYTPFDFVQSSVIDGDGRYLTLEVDDFFVGSPNFAGFVDWNIYQVKDGALELTTQAINFRTRFDRALDLELSSRTNTIHDADTLSERGIIYMDEACLVMGRAGNTTYAVSAGVDPAGYFLRFSDGLEFLWDDSVAKGVEFVESYALVGSRLYIRYRGDNDSKWRISLIELGNLQRVNKPAWAVPTNDVVVATVLHDDATDTGVNKATNWKTWGFDNAGYFALVKAGVIGTNEGIVWWNHGSTTPVGQQELDTNISDSPLGLFREQDP